MSVAVWQDDRIAHIEADRIFGSVELQPTAAALDHMKVRVAFGQPQAPSASCFGTRADLAADPEQSQAFREQIGFNIACNMPLCVWRFGHKACILGHCLSISV